MCSLTLITYKLKVAVSEKSLELKRTFRHNLVQYGSSIFNVFHFAYSQGGRAGLPLAAHLPTPNGNAAH